MISLIHFAPRYSIPHAENAVRDEATLLYLACNEAPFWFFRVWSTRYLAVRAHLANRKLSLFLGFSFHHFYQSFRLLPKKKLTKRKRRTQTGGNYRRALEEKIILFFRDAPTRARARETPHPTKRERERKKEREGDSRRSGWSRRSRRE